jgi:hypothetical protein
MQTIQLASVSSSSKLFNGRSASASPPSSSPNSLSASSFGAVSDPLRDLRRLSSELSPRLKDLRRLLRVRQERDSSPVTLSSLEAASSGRVSAGVRAASSTRIAGMDGGGVARASRRPMRRERGKDGQPRARNANNKTPHTNSRSFCATRVEAVAGQPESCPDEERFERVEWPAAWS